MELLVSNLIQLNRFSSIQSLHWAPAAAAAAAAAGTFWLRSGHLMLVYVVCHAPGRVRSSVPLTTRHPRAKMARSSPVTLSDLCSCYYGERQQQRPIDQVHDAAEQRHRWSMKRDVTVLAGMWWCVKPTKLSEPLLMCRATCNFSSA